MNDNRRKRGICNEFEVLVLVVLETDCLLERERGSATPDIHIPNVIVEAF